MNENYLFYRNVFSGRKIPEDRFESYFSRGRDYINAKYGGIEAAEEIKNKAACAIAELYYSYEPENMVSSESIGDHSVTYAVNTAYADPLESRLAQTAALYFGNIGIGWC